jgi:hypothetical protein
MKTPEELAEEYTRDWWGSLPEAEGMRKSARENFLAGYKAAQEYAHASLEEAEARHEAYILATEENFKWLEAKLDHNADASKVIKPTHVAGRDELNCMIAHFENEEYKISVIVPGVLPKADEGELKRHCNENT